MDEIPPFIEKVICVNDLLKVLLDFSAFIAYYCAAGTNFCIRLNHLYMKTKVLFVVLVLVSFAANAVYISGKYLGNGAASKSISGLGFQPEVVLVKGASSQDGWIATSTMTAGRAKLLTSNAAPATGYINSIDVDGFTVGNSSASNTNAAVYYFVAWDNGDAGITVGSFTPVTCGASAWANSTYYGPGSMVTYGGSNYHAQVGHNSNSATNRPDLNDGSWRNVGACSVFGVNINVGYRPEMLWIFGEGVDNLWGETSPAQFTFDNSNSDKMANFTQGSVISGAEKVNSDLYASGFTTGAVSNNLAATGGPANGVKYNYVAFKPGSLTATGAYTGTAANNLAVATVAPPNFIMVKNFAGGQNTWFKTSAMGVDTSYKFTGGPDVTNVKKFTATGFTLGVGGEVNTNASNYEYFMMSGGMTLPVKLLSFNASKQGEAVLVEWQTAMEINSNSFVVERSADGIHFSTIATLEGAGNSNAVLDYLFTDHAPLTGSNYYRLRQYDLDGANELFHTVGLNFNNGLALLQLQVNSNLLEDEAQFTFDAEAQGQYVFEIFDAIGQRLYVSDVSASKGNNRIDLSFANYSSAYFIARITSPKQESQQIKLLKK